MKRKLLYVAVAAASFIAFVSCSSEYHKGVDFERDVHITDLLTIKRAETGEVYFQYRNLKLLPSIECNYELPQRALASLTISPNKIDGYNECYVEWLEPLEKGAFKLSPSYTSPSSQAQGDGLDLLLDSSLTILEDGFLSLHYNTWWGEYPVHHDFTLICTGSAGNDYSFILIQDSNGDSKYIQSEGIICFDVSSVPVTSEEQKTITLNWIKLDGSAGTARFELE